MEDIKINIKKYGIIRRRLHKDEVKLEELIDLIYELVAKNNRLEEKIEEIESIEVL